MNKKKILVADDDPNILEMMRVNLSSNYDVICCDNGEMTLEKVKTEKPDLLILDVMMPKIDGYTLDLELKDVEETANIPVIIITGRSDIKHLFDETKSAKFVNWFEKPIDIEQVIKCVDKILATPNKTKKRKN